MSKELIARLMCKNWLSFVFLLCLNGFKASGQEKPVSRNHFFSDVSIRVAGDQWGGGLTFWGNRSLGKTERWRIGLGLRHSTHVGSDMEFITAPARLTGKEENLDTLVLGKSSVTSFNLALDFRYRAFPSFWVGFNIDAIGVSFGKEQMGSIRSGFGSFQPKANPTNLNALLVGDNDIGTLNSEFYILYALNDRFHVKAGLSYLFTEYTTDSKPILDNDRFRNKSMTGMIGIQYKLK